MFASKLLKCQVTHTQKLKTQKQHVFTICSPVLRFLKCISACELSKGYGAAAVNHKGFSIVSETFTLHGIKKEQSGMCAQGRKEDTMLNMLRNSLLS